MKAFIQSQLALAAAREINSPSIIYYMPGAIPTDKASLLASVNMADISDIHAKSVGYSILTGTAAYEDVGHGKSSITYTSVNANRTCLKGGTTKVGSAYIATPSKAYNDFRMANTMQTVPPALFYAPSNIFTGASTYIENTVRVAESIDVATSLGAFSAPYILEYESAITLSSLHFFNGIGVIGSQYSYRVKVEYWNDTAWATAFAGTTVTASSALTVIPLTTPATSSKWRITLLPYEMRVNYPCLRIYGIALSHTSPPAPVSVPDITWGIIVPYNETSASSLPFYRLNVTAESASGVRRERTIANCLASANYVPAIIDTCGENSMTSKIAISKATGLTSDDKPSVLAYKYYTGDLL